MVSVHGGLGYWNERWGTVFSSWAAVQPPEQPQHGNATAADAFYWDWQHFWHRQQRLAYEGCCQRIAARGFRCTMRFPEVFTRAGAIRSPGSAFAVAGSPFLDYIVVGFGFVAVPRQPKRARTLQLLISATKPFNKPVFFEGAAAGQAKGAAVDLRALELAAASGAYGLGINQRAGQWRARGSVRSVLGDLPPPAAPAAPGPPVAIIIPHRSYWAFKGTPKDKAGVLIPTDPQQDRLFRCLDEVERVVPSLDGLQIFGVPSMLLPVLRSFEHVWYLEPDALLSGDANSVGHIKQQAALLGVPLHECAKKAAPAVVVPECCPTM